MNKITSASFKNSAMKMLSSSDWKGQTNVYLFDIVLSDGVLIWIITIVTLISMEMKNRTQAKVMMRTMMTLSLYWVFMSRM